MSDNDWYPFNPMEHRRETYHLTATQDGIYRLLLDAYYISREPLPDSDKVLAWLAKCSRSQFAPHSKVIREFFEARDGKLYHARCDKWIRRTQQRPSGEAWNELRSSIFKRDDYTCQYCGERGGKLECDHVIPVSKGGAHEPGNLTTSCFTCNRSKRDKLLHEWRQ